MNSKLIKIAQYFDLRLKLADSAPSSGPISTPLSSKRILDLNNFERVNDDILECYIFFINQETKKQIGSKRIQIKNESLPRIKERVKNLLNAYAEKYNQIIEAKIVLKVQSLWRAEMEFEPEERVDFEV